MGHMYDKRLLSLGQAAAETGYARHELREMLCRGRLYGVRIDGRWRIARGDLEMLRQPAMETHADIAASTYPETALRTMLAERDQLIRQLQEENATRAAQCKDLRARLAAVVAGPLAPEPDPHESACAVPTLPQHQQANARAVGEDTPGEAPDTPVPLNATVVVSRGFPRQHLIARLTTILRRFNRA